MALSRQPVYLVFGSSFDFRLHKLTFFRKIASAARSYRRKIFTYIKVNRDN